MLFLGRQMKLRHFRNSVELPYIASDQRYDFNYQVKIKHLHFFNILKCIYSTDIAFYTQIVVITSRVSNFKSIDRLHFNQFETKYIGSDTTVGRLKL